MSNIVQLSVGHENVISEAPPEQVQMMRLCRSMMQELQLLVEGREYDLAMEFTHAAVPLLTEAPEPCLEQALVSYIGNHPDRRELPHWQALFD
ncbi:MAG: hypothetical protein COA42_01280 [Alteromonadaceae bacterium]|nr:MAG: hypothetical protein COA42_01280 [Alteromonadaceae bacterium]